MAEVKLLEFIDSRIARPTVWPRNQHVTHPGWKEMYVRVTKRYLGGQIREPVIDLAAIEAIHPGKGAFRALVTELRKLYPQASIFVESVQPERFKAGLLRMGFTQRENDEPSYYLLPESKWP